MNEETQLPFGDILLDKRASGLVRSHCKSHPPYISPAQWKRTLSTLTDRIKFSPAASENDVAELERHFCFGLPDELRGVWANTSAIMFDEHDYILYPPEMVRSTHQDLVAMRHWMPLEHLVFIGGIGDGDQFAFGRCVSGEFHLEIFRWSHDTDSRIACSLGLYDYILRHVAWRMTAIQPS